MTDCACRIRTATATDTELLLGMMRELATFEEYLDAFAITAEELQWRGWPESGASQFTAVVAELPDGGLAGYAVGYCVPFTYDLRPTMVMKELFVRSSCRGSGVGGALFAEMRARAEASGCGLLRWAVLPSNERAKEFYRNHGGSPDPKWEYWCMPIAPNPARNPETSPAQSFHAKDHARR